MFFAIFCIFFKKTGICLSKQIFWSLKKFPKKSDFFCFFYILVNKKRLCVMTRGCRADRTGKLKSASTRKNACRSAYRRYSRSFCQNDIRGELEKPLKYAIVIHCRVSDVQLKISETFNVTQKTTFSIKSGTFYRTEVNTETA